MMTRDTVTDEALVVIAREGGSVAREEAYVELIERTTALRKHFALRSMTSKKTRTYSLEDAEATTMIALMRAVEKYDETKKAKFKTYLHTWLRRFCEHRTIAERPLPFAQLDLVLRSDREGRTQLDRAELGAEGDQSLYDVIETFEFELGQHVDRRIFGGNDEE